MEMFETTIKDVIDMCWPTIIIVMTIIVVMRLATYFNGERRSCSLYKELLNLIFMTYILILFQLVTSQDLATGGVNLTPFTEIFRYKVGSKLFYKQVIGNILLFVPLGFFVTNYCNIKKFGGITIITLISSLTIETVQYFIGRCFDIDDIILNVLGGLIGFLIYIALNAIRKHLPNILKKDWFYNLLCILIIVIIVLSFLGLI